MMKILLLMLLLQISIVSQTNFAPDTLIVYPYQRVVIPTQPVIYFPVASLNFAERDIRIQNLTDGSRELTDTNEVKIIKTNIYHSWHGRVSNNGRSISFDINRYRGMGFPVSINAEMVFFKPGKTYKTIFQPRIYNSDLINPPGLLRINRNEVFCKVEYPRLILSYNVDTTGYLGEYSIRTGDMRREMIFALVQYPFESEDKSGSFSPYSIEVELFQNSQSLPEIFVFDSHVLDLEQFNSNRYISDSVVVTVKYGLPGMGKDTFLYKTDSGSIHPSVWWLKIKD